MTRDLGRGVLIEPYQNAELLELGIDPASLTELGVEELRRRFVDPELLFVVDDDPRASPEGRPAELLVLEDDVLRWSGQSPSGAWVVFDEYRYRWVRENAGGQRRAYLFRRKPAAGGGRRLVPILKFSYAMEGPCLFIWPGIGSRDLEEVGGNGAEKASEPTETSEGACDEHG